MPKPFCAVARMMHFAPVILLLLAVRSADAESPRGDRPNVIVIMADDIGAEGLGCYGSTIYSTPHLDQMAADGVRFNNAYATPLCTPTRVMIMSGLYPNRTGFRALISKDAGVRMPASIKTFGHYFRDAGYRTAMAGKWQLGKFDEHPGQPVEHGFDEYCMWTWFYGGKKSSRYYAPGIYRDGKVIDGGKEDFGPDFYSDFVLDFIDRNRDESFFVYYPMALVHSPFLHPPSLEELAKSKFSEDLDKNTVAFGHMITYMDHLVGSIRERLRKHGIDRNTLILFTGDNGTGKPITSQLAGMKLKGGKGTMTEAGSRVPFLAAWPGVIEAGGVREELFCLADVLPTIASISGIQLAGKVDGMDLSHNLLGIEGTDRRHVLINFGKGFFVREKRFRLNEDGKMYDIPVTSDATRYSERLVDDPQFEEERARLQAILDSFMAIESEFNGANPAKGDEKSRKKKK